MTPDAMAKWLDALLKSGADLNATDKNGVTPLHHAVRFRSPVVVKRLIQLGANVNQACRRSGSTPLHRATTSTGAPHTAGKQKEARQIVKLLLAAGADPALRNRRDKRPADYTKDDELLRLLAASMGTVAKRSGRLASAGGQARRKVT